MSGLRVPRAIVFDLDGTLIDSRADIRTAINRTREGLGLAPLSLEAVVMMVGEGARKLIERATADHTPPLKPQEIDAALAAYLDHYDRLCLDETRPYPGIEEMLAALGTRFPLALLSNKGEALSRKILEGLGLTRHLQEILGGDSLPHRKPDPAGLHRLADCLKLPVEDLLLVGDTWIDGAAARNAGCQFVLVEWGFPRPPKVAEIAADLRIGRPEELVLALGVE